MATRKVAKGFAAAVVLLGFSQCTTPSPTVSGHDETRGEAYTELTSYRDDLINQLPPEYPAGARPHHYQSSGVYRITFNYDSGRAVGVAVLKTTGQAVLDHAAIAALQKWRVRPSSQHSIDVTVRFVASHATTSATTSRMRPFPGVAPPSFRPTRFRPP